MLLSCMLFDPLVLVGSTLPQLAVHPLKLLLLTIPPPTNAELRSTNLCCRHRTAGCGGEVLFEISHLHLFSSDVIFWGPPCMSPLKAAACINESFNSPLELSPHKNFSNVGKCACVGISGSDFQQSLCFFCTRGIRKKRQGCSINIKW